MADSDFDNAFIQHLANLAVTQRAIRGIHIMDLSDSILDCIFAILHDIDVPVLGRRESGGNPGWFAISWVCRRWRVLLLAQPSAFARSYTQFPGAQTVFKARAAGLPLFYHLAPAYPRLAAGQLINCAADQARTEVIRKAADFPSCSRIWVLKRGDAVAHLRHLVLISSAGSLSMLEELRVSIQYEQQNAASFMRDVNHPSFTGNLYAPRLLRAFFDSTWLPIKAYGLQVVSVRWDDLANTTRPMAYVVGLRLIVPHAASLLTLELCDALESPPPSVDPLRLLEAPDFQPLHLPKLQALTISGCILSYVRLLGALRPPPNVCVSVSVDSRRLVDSRRVNHEIVPVSTALAAVLQRLPTPRDRVNNIVIRAEDLEDDTLRLTMSGWECEIGVGQTESSKELLEDVPPLVSITLDGLDEDVDWEPYLEQFMDRIGQGSVCAVRFSVPDDLFHEGVVDWVAVFRALPSVRVIQPLARVRQAISSDRFSGRRLLVRLESCHDPDP